MERSQILYFAKDRGHAAMGTGAVQSIQTYSLTGLSHHQVIILSVSRSHSCNAQTAAAPRSPWGLKPLWQWQQKQTSFIKVIFISEFCLLRETLLIRCHDSPPAPVLSLYLLVCRCIAKAMEGERGTPTNQPASQGELGGNGATSGAEYSSMLGAES